MAHLSGFHVAVLATDGFEESELTEPVAALRDAGASVTIISLKPGEIQGFRHLEKGTRVRVDRVIGDVTAAEFDAVHSVHRALRVGSVHEIIPPSRLRPRLIEAIEAGVQAASSAAPEPAAGSEPLGYERTRAALMESAK